MAEDSKGYLVGPNFYSKLKRTIAAVEGTPMGSGGYRFPTDLSGDPPRQGSSVQLAAYPADQTWRKGEVMAVSMYTHDGTGFGATGETATAINVSVDYAPMSLATDGTASGPTPTMAWCVVSDAAGAYVAIEAEPEPLLRIGTRSSDNSEWPIGGEKPVITSGTGDIVDVTNPFDHYTTLDTSHGLVIARGATSPDGSTSHLVIGPPPIPMHAAIATPGEPWERNQTRVVTVLSDGVRTTEGQTVTVSNPFFDSVPVESGVPLPIGKFGTAFHVISAPSSSVKFGDYTPSSKDDPWDRSSERPVKLWGSEEEVIVVNPFEHYTNLDIHHGLAFAKSSTNPSGGEGSTYVAIGPPSVPMHVATSKEPGVWRKGAVRTLVAEPSTLLPEPQPVDVQNKFFDDLDVTPGDQVAIGKFGGEYFVISSPAAVPVKFGDYTPPDKDSPWDRSSERSVRPWGSDEDVLVVNPFDHYTNLDLQHGLAFAKSPINPTGGEGTAYIVIGPPSVPLHVATSKEKGEWSRGEVRTLVAEADALRPNPKIVDVTNRFYDSVDFQPGQEIAIGKIGSEYCLLTGSDAGLKRITSEMPQRIRKDVDVQLLYDGTFITAVSYFDGYEAADLTDGVVVAKVRNEDTGESENAIIAPPPVPLHIVDYTAGPTWVKGQQQPTLLRGRARHGGGSSQLLTTADGAGVRNEIVGDIEPGDTPLVVGKFGDQLHVIAAEPQPGVKLATRTDDSTWEKGSLRDVTLFGTEQTVQAYNAAGNYESFDGRSTGGLPDLALAKGKAPGGQGTAYYVISPAPITFATGTFSGSWAKGQTKDIGVSLGGRSGTITVINKVGNIGSAASGSSSKYCAMAKQDTQWYLVSFEIGTATAVFSKQTATATVVSQSESGVIFTGVSTQVVVTDVSTEQKQVMSGVTASLNTSSCSVAVTPSYTNVTSVSGVTKKTISIPTDQQTVLFVKATATMSVVMSTYTATYITLET